MSLRPEAFTQPRSLSWRGTLFAFRLVLTLVLGLLVLYHQKEGAPLPWTFHLLALYVAGNGALLYLPEALYARVGVQAALFLLDTAVVTGAIYTTWGMASDLYLFYFLVVFMSGLQRDIRQSFLTGGFACALYAGLWLRSNDFEFEDASALLRFPLLLTVTFFTAFYVDRAQEEARGREKERRAKRRLEATIAVHEAGKAVFALPRLAQLLPTIAGLSRDMFKARDAVILLQGKGGPKTAAASGVSSDEALRSREILVERALERRGSRPQRIPGPLSQHPLYGDLPHLEGIRSVLLSPIVDRDGLLGVVCLQRGEEAPPFGPLDLRCLAILCSQVAQAIRNARLYEALEEKAAQLRHAQKLEAVGRLAAGLAHELKNPLSGVIANAQFLERELDGPHGPEQVQLAKDIISSGRRCDKIIKNLLVFSKEGPESRNPCLVSALLDQALSLCGKRFELSNVQLERDIAGGLWTSGNEVQLQQVFFNLFMNALLAMPSGGTLSLSARSLSLPEEESHRHCVPGGSFTDPASSPGPWVPTWIMAEVADTGAGITRPVLERLFEPFFTTRETDQGTGLGLAVSYEIVHRHGGHMWARSGGDGQGARFTLLLPRVSEASPS